MGNCINLGEWISESHWFCPKKQATKRNENSRTGTAVRKKKRKENRAINITDNPQESIASNYQFPTPPQGTKASQVGLCNGLAPKHSILRHGVDGMLAAPSLLYASPTFKHDRTDNVNLTGQRKAIRHPEEKR